MMEIQHDCTELVAMVRSESREAMRPYQDATQVDSLRAYHVASHPKLVKPVALAFAGVIFGKDSLWLPVTSMAVDGHDVEPPQRIVEEDTSRPELFVRKFMQQFNGESERQSSDWLTNLTKAHAPEEIIRVLGDAVIATTTEVQDGVILQPKIAEASNPKLAFAVAKADVLHQMACEHNSRLDASLQLWLEQYPDFAAELLQNQNFAINDDQYWYIVGELLAMAPYALQFFESQRELFYKDGAKVFGANRLADLNAMMTRLLMRNRPFEQTYDTKQWEWLHSKEALVQRLREAIPFAGKAKPNKK
jgi:hypothetical protein